jgi:hypothetical protein
MFFNQNKSNIFASRNLSYNKYKQKNILNLLTFKFFQQ